MLEPSSQGATTGEVLCYNGATMPRFAAIVFAVSWNQRHGCWDHGHRKLEPAAVMLQPRWQHAGSGMARSWNRHPNLLRWRWGGGTGELFCWNRHAFLLLPAKFSAATSYPRASTFFESSSSACYDRRPTSPELRASPWGVATADTHCCMCVADGKHRRRGQRPAASGGGGGDRRRGQRQARHARRCFEAGCVARPWRRVGSFFSKKKMSGGGRKEIVWFEIV